MDNTNLSPGCIIRDTEGSQHILYFKMGNDWITSNADPVLKVCDVLCVEYPAPTKWKPADWIRTLQRSHYGLAGLWLDVCKQPCNYPALEDEGELESELAKAIGWAIYCGHHTLEGMAGNVRADMLREEGYAQDAADRLNEPTYCPEPITVSRHEL